MTQRNPCFFAHGRGPLTVVQRYTNRIHNSGGRRMVSEIAGEGRTLSPPGAGRLENIVANYKSDRKRQTGAWECRGSLTLLVFRFLLVDTTTMVRAPYERKKSQPSDVNRLIDRSMDPLIDRYMDPTLENGRDDSKTS